MTPLRERLIFAAALFAVSVLVIVIVVATSTTNAKASPTRVAPVTTAATTAAPVTTATKPVTTATKPKAAPAKDVAVENFPDPNPVTSTPAPVAPATKAPSGYGCAAALAYLHTHAEPHFTIVCRPGSASNSQGGPAQAMTCVSHPPQCPANTGVIAISNPCPTAYMNEAANSWIALGIRPGAMDPYGPSC